MILYRLLITVLLLGLAACAKQADLPDTVVSAASREDFTRFRADLGTRFTAEDLKDFDTATRELQLDAMNRDVASAEGREFAMLQVANGKTIRAVTLLGWQARKARFLREIADITTSRTRSRTTGQDRRHRHTRIRHPSHRQRKRGLGEIAAQPRRNRTPPR